MSEKSYSGLKLSETGEGDALPLEFEVSASSKMNVLTLITVFILILVAFNINDMLPAYLLQALEDKGMPSRTLLPVGFVVLALYLFVKSIFGGMGQRKKIQIDGTTVHVQSSSMLGKREWSEPLNSYSGVRWTRFAIHENRRTETARVSTRYRHVIELVHADTAKIVPLFLRETGRADSLATLALVRKAFSSKELSEEGRKDLEEEAARLGRQADAGNPREHWERFSALLNLPAIDARDGAEAVRAAEDVNKSIKELASEGKLDVGWENASPPACLQLKPLGDAGKPETQQLQILIRSGNTPGFLLSVFSGIAALLLIAGLLSMQFGAIVGGLLFGGIVYGIKYLERRNPRSLTVTGGELRYDDPMVSSRNFTMPLDAIESIEVRDRDTRSIDSVKTPKLLGKKLLISSDEKEKAVAGGTPEDGLVWLRGYLLNAVASERPQSQQ